MNITEQNIIRKFRRLLAEKMRVDRIALFGSRVRVDAAPDSDMDLLVILLWTIACQASMKVGILELARKVADLYFWVRL